MDSAVKKNQNNQEIETEFFQGKCSEAKYEILKHLIKDLIEFKDLPSEKLIEKYAKKDKLAQVESLEKEQKQFFQRIILDVYLDLIVTKPELFKGMLMLSLNAGDKDLHGKIVKEISYPIIIELIGNVQKNAPNAFKEEIEKPINPKLKEILELFSL